MYFSWYHLVVTVWWFGFNVWLSSSYSSMYNCQKFNGEDVMISLFQVAHDSILYCMVSGLTWSQLSDHLVFNELSFSSADSCILYICLFLFFFFFFVHSQIFCVCRKRLTIQSLFIVTSLSPGCINYICRKLLTFILYIIYISLIIPSVQVIQATWSVRWCGFII